MLINNTVVIPIVCFYKVQINYTNYPKREKIRWAKHVRFYPYEGFHGNTLRCLACSVYYLTTAKYSWENFRSTLKNCENHESLAQRTFPVYGIV